MEYSSSKLVMKSSMSCFSPVGSMISIHTFLSTVDVVDPSNILSGMAFGKYVNFSLFTITNASCTKLWEDPESKSAWNGQCRFWVEGRGGKEKMSLSKETWHSVGEFCCYFFFQLFH